MNDTSKRCLKCQGQMIQGFIPDNTQGAVLVTCWQPGKPKTSFWTRTKARTQDWLPIGVFRCERCGFLEFFANKEYAAT